MLILVGLADYFLQSFDAVIQIVKIVMLMLRQAVSDILIACQLRFSRSPGGYLVVFRNGVWIDKPLAVWFVTEQVNTFTGFANE